MSEPKPEGKPVPPATGGSSGSQAAKAAPSPKPAARPAPKKPAPPKGPDPSLQRRRRFVWWAVFSTLGAWGLATARFFFPRVLFEPKTRFPIGQPADYAIGVDTKWQQAKRIWVVRQPGRLFVILARCTHLGCTPDWKPAENKFKCPCHGSGFDMEGVNFEGPAPQPLLRCHVELSARGEIVVDKGRLYPVDKWEDPGAYLAV